MHAAEKHFPTEAKVTNNPVETLSSPEEDYPSIKVKRLSPWKTLLVVGVIGGAAAALAGGGGGEPSPSPTPDNPQPPDEGSITIDW